MSTSSLRVISLGAGVQSSALYLLAVAGEVGGVDAAIFADTGWEPAAVYEHLKRLEAHGDDRVPIYRVSSGNIRDTERQKDFYDAPYFLLNEDGSEGMARRQCTHQLKLRPIRRKLNELLKQHGISKAPGCTESLLGISLDEVQRMKDSDVLWNVNGYPLVDRRWTRADCTKYLEAEGWAAPRSACIGCPYHSNAEWRALRDDSPAEFADAVAFEREIQATNAGLRGKPFLHASRVPLDLVDLATAEDRGQLNFDAECEGMCGV